MTANALFTCLLFFRLVALDLPAPTLGIAAHSVLGSALGLLLVFRTNTAYSRFWEGRKIWEDILGLGRELTRNAVIFRRQMGLGPAARVIRYTQAFSLCMIEHLRGKADKALRAKLEVLLQDLERILEEEESKSFLNHLRLCNNRPLFLVNVLADTIAAIPNEEGGQAVFTNRERIWLLGMVDHLSSSIGACERLVQTPVPLSYVRHTSRFLSFFMLTLPWALVDHLGVLTVPVTCLTGWAFFGILEIGLIIEDPFQGVLKLEVVANTLESDVEETVRFLGADELLVQTGQPPSTKDTVQLAKAQELAQASTPASGKSSASGSVDLEDIADHVLSSYKSIDLDDGGVISQSELRSALQALDSSRWTDERVEQVMQIADSNSDGDVSQEEWLQLINSAHDLLQVSKMPLSKPLPADSRDDDVFDQEEDDEEKISQPEESKVDGSRSDRQGDFPPQSLAVGGAEKTIA